jgi:hypothetical protein
MSIVFVANRSFDDFTLLSRAFAVAVEGEFRAGRSDIDAQALENLILSDMLIQLSDSTRDFLTQKGIRVNVEPTYVGAIDHPDTIVAFGKLNYYPHNALVKAARLDRNITVLEY